MDRELLIEIGCEEIPAGWLPGLTAQMAQHVDARLKEARLTSDAPAEAYSTPRRLTARVIRVAERQTDFEELVTGPPVSAAYKPDGEPTPAAAGFAKKYGVDMAALERHADAERRVPRLSREAAWQGDGRRAGRRDGRRAARLLVSQADALGRLPRGRQRRSRLRASDSLARAPLRRTRRPVRDPPDRSGAGTDGAGHPLRARTPTVIASRRRAAAPDARSRSRRSTTIRSGCSRTSSSSIAASASRRSGASSKRTRAGLAAGSAPTSRRSHRCCVRCRTSSSIQRVVAGHIPIEFLQLPEEVLTTTMIHHQHYFPVVDEDGKLKPAFLAVTNMEAEKPEIISRNSERVLTARLRDARFFYDEDRKTTLESRIDRLSTILFHKKLGTYREKADRVAALAAWIASEAFGQPAAAAQAEQAGRLCKADLATDMVRELTELQGTMGGIYAREEGLPDAIWKAIYFHYLPIGVEAEAPPTRQHLGAAAVTWAAVSLADKLDSVVGMFTAGERPTGSRDPLGLRRQAQGAVKILADLPELTGHRSTAEARHVAGTGRGAVRRLRRCRRAAVLVHGRSSGVSAERTRLRRPQRAGGDARRHRGCRARSRRAASSRRCRR